MSLLTLRALKDAGTFAENISYPEPWRRINAHEMVANFDGEKYSVYQMLQQLRNVTGRTFCQRQSDDEPVYSLQIEMSDNDTYEWLYGAEIQRVGQK